MNFKYVILKQESPDDALKVLMWEEEKPIHSAAFAFWEKTVKIFDVHYTQIDYFIELADSIICGKEKHNNNVSRRTEALKEGIVISASDVVLVDVLVLCENCEGDLDSPCHEDPQCTEPQAFLASKREINFPVNFEKKCEELSALLSSTIDANTQGMNAAIEKYEKLLNESKEAQNVNLEVLRQHKKLITENNLMFYHLKRLCEAVKQNDFNINWDAFTAANEFVINKGLQDTKDSKVEKRKFRIKIIDFMKENGKHEVGKDKNQVNVCLGDVVEYNGEKNWFVAYRYGKVMLKQVGMMAMIGSEKFDKGDFSSVEKLNVFGAGADWLIIGYTDEPLYEKVKHLEEIDS